MKTIEEITKKYIGPETETGIEELRKSLHKIGYSCSEYVYQEWNTLENRAAEIYVKFNKNDQFRVHAGTIKKGLVEIYKSFKDLKKFLDNYQFNERGCEEK